MWKYFLVAAFVLTAAPAFAQLSVSSDGKSTPGTPATTVPTQVVAAQDGQGNAQPVQATTQGVIYVYVVNSELGALARAAAPALLPPCNAVRKQNCK